MLTRSSLKEINEIPVISIGHLPTEDSNKLCGWRERLLSGKELALAALVTMENEYGWILSTGLSDDAEDFDEALKEFFSLELLNLLTKFRGLGFNYVWLDADGLEVEDLEFFCSRSAFAVSNKQELEMVSQALDMGNHYEIPTNVFENWINSIQPLVPRTVSIPAGVFSKITDERCLKISVQSFEMGIHPVTQAEYLSVMGKNPSWFQGNSDAPVENVNWFEATEYCENLSILTGKKYRLPSEVEWEYACRAGSTGDFAFPELNSSNANFGNQNKKPITSSSIANAFGLYDMHGNVWEWCQDEDKLRRVLRGGSWFNGPWSCRSADRFVNPPDARDVNIGFRVLLQKQTFE